MSTENIERSLGRIESTMENCCDRITSLEVKVDSLRIDRAKISGVQYFIITILGFLAGFFGEYLRR